MADYNAPHECDSLQEFERTMEYFIRLVNAGKRPGSSSGERACFLMALAAIDFVPGLDEQALQGLRYFIRCCHVSPNTAQTLVGPVEPSMMSRS